MINEELYYINKYDAVRCGYNSTYKTDTAPTKSGEEHCNALLTNDDVFDIRERYKDICMPRDVYATYKDRISYSTFLNIWRGHTWKNIHMDVYTPENKRKHFVVGNQHKIYTDERFDTTRKCVIPIRELYAEEKLSPNDVYKRFCFLNRNTFNDIWYGKTYKDLMPEEYVRVREKGRKYIRVGNNKGEKR